MDWISSADLLVERCEMVKEGISKKITFIIFALLTAFFAIQRIMDKQYFLAVLMAAVLIVGGNQIFKKECGLETETDIYIGMTALLWTLYYCLVNKEQAVIFLGYLKENKQVWICVILLFVIYKLTDSFIKYMPVSVAVKTVGGIAVIQIFLNKSGELLNYTVAGCFGVVLFVGLTAWKRMVIRGYQEFSPLKSLYNLSVILIICILCNNFMNIGKVQSILGYPLADMNLTWFVPVAVLVAAGLRMYIEPANRGNQIFAGNLILILVYYLMVKKGFLPWSYGGIIVSCVLSGWLITWLIKRGFLKAKHSIPVFYLCYISIMVIVTEAFGHHRYSNMMIIFIALILLSIGNGEERVTKGVFFALVFVPFFIMIAAKASIENKNYTALIILTGLVAAVYIYVYLRNHGIKEAVRFGKGYNVILFLCIMLPLLFAARNAVNDNRFANLQMAAQYYPYSMGTGIYGDVTGDIQEVKFIWGDGKTEVFHNKLGIYTPVRDNRLKIEAFDANGKTYTYHRYFMFWKNSEALGRIDMDKPSLTLEKVEENGVTKLNFICADSKSDIASISFWIDGKEVRTIPNESEAEDKKNWTYTLEYPTGQAYNIVASCRDMQGNYSSLVYDSVAASAEQQQ